MLIRQLAETAGVSVDTIRFYEKSGLLRKGSHFNRAANGYRIYTAEALLRLELIKNGHDAGFTLRQMREGIEAWENNGATRAQRETALLGNLEKIELQIKRLEAMKSYILHKLEKTTGKVGGNTEEGSSESRDPGTEPKPKGR